MWGISLEGDKDMLRGPIEGVEVADMVREYVPPSDSARWEYPDGRVADAKTAAVAAAASSTVPVWWFLCRVKVVRRVKVFWQSAYGHLYGLLPEWMRRCRARELESLKGYWSTSSGSFLTPFPNVGRTLLHRSHM